MLSENELVELLEQLKLGALHGVASESDPVGHWPVLVGDGLCLSLQSAARDEFARQPDHITVLDGLADGSSVTELCSRFWCVHHVNTGQANRSILIGYSRECLDILSLLQDAAEDDGRVSDSCAHSNVAHDFSQAVASSIDPAFHRNEVDHPVAFLPLEFDAQTTVAGGWRIRIDVSGQQGEFFIGLLNPRVNKPDHDVTCTASKSQCTEAEIRVQVKTLSRAAGSTKLHVTLTLPERVHHFFPARVRSVDLRQEGNDLSGKFGDFGDSTAFDVPELDLMVQQSLQLAADDLYLLLLEAMGVGSGLHIRFDPMADNDMEFCLTDGDRFECLTINMLPVKYAELLFNDGELSLIVNE